VTAADLLAEFGGRIDGRVHIAPESLLGRDEGVDDGREGRVPHDQQVDVTVIVQVPADGRPEDEGERDPVGKRRERFAQHVDGAGRFQEEQSQLRKHRRGAIRLEIDLPPRDRALEDPGAREGVEFTLNRAVRGTRLPHDLAQVEGLIGVPEKPGQNAAPCLPEQDGAGVSWGGALPIDRTHFGYKCTRFAYEVQEIDRASERDPILGEGTDAGRRRDRDPRHPTRSTIIVASSDSSAPARNARTASSTRVRTASIPERFTVASSSSSRSVPYCSPCGSKASTIPSV